MKRVRITVPKAGPYRKGKMLAFSDAVAFRMVETDHVAIWADRVSNAEMQRMKELYGDELTAEELAETDKPFNYDDDDDDDDDWDDDEEDEEPQASTEKQTKDEEPSVRTIPAKKATRKPRQKKKADFSVLPPDEA